MMMIMGEEGRDRGTEGGRATRNTNHVDVKMNCCKLGRRCPEEEERSLITGCPWGGWQFLNNESAGHFRGWLDTHSADI